MKHLLYRSIALLGICILSLSFGLTAKPVKKGVEVVSLPKQKMVKIFIDGKLFTAYRWLDTIYKPILWPINSPLGEPITRSWPLSPLPGERVDHPHHVGHWFNHGDVNGHDFWNNSTQIGKEHKGPFGKVVHQKIIKTQSGSSKGLLVIEADWVDKDGAVMVKEEATFAFIKVTASEYKIERSSKLTAVQEKVVFKDNKEGMFAVRLCRALEQPSTKPEVFTDANGIATAVPVLNNEGVTGHYTASSGIGGDSVWGTRATWVTMAGKIKGKPTSVTIYDDAKNPGAPTYWHARGYGLFSANPLGQAVFTKGVERLDLTLAKGESKVFKFSIVVKN